MCFTSWNPCLPILIISHNASKRPIYPPSQDFNWLPFVSVETYWAHVLTLSLSFTQVWWQDNQSFASLEQVRNERCKISDAGIANVFVIRSPSGGAAFVYVLTGFTLIRKSLARWSFFFFRKSVWKVSLMLCSDRSASAEGEKKKIPKGSTTFSTLVATISRQDSSSLFSFESKPRAVTPPPTPAS